MSNKSLTQAIQDKLQTQKIFEKKQTIFYFQLRHSSYVYTTFCPFVSLFLCFSVRYEGVGRNVQQNVQQNMRGGQKKLDLEKFHQNEKSTTTPGRKCQTQKNFQEFFFVFQILFSLILIVFFLAATQQLCIYYFLFLRLWVCVWVCLCVGLFVCYEKMSNKCPTK